LIPEIFGYKLESIDHEISTEGVSEDKLTEPEFPPEQTL
jgi:hypothetical protein